ncbi:MAG: flavin reductase [Clostridia bacterium]|jgi:flavin reductase (DIM6/NTAB) family NADH-FMN oxidoreductase RutF/rubredoxin|nr:flavin reductase [Clostridia bacterium]
MNTKVFRNISYGVYIITAMDGERPTGCTANSAMQITSAPATIAISINHDNFTNGCIKKTKKFAISILAETSAPLLIGTFGFKSGKDTDKFTDVTYEMREDLPVIQDSCGYIVCKVIDQMETATHTVFLGEVIDGDVFNASGQPMTYAYYHQVIKGKSPKNAPTYLPDEEKKLVKYECQVCGHIYEGENLPEDYICPICGVNAEHFKKIS